MRSGLVFDIMRFSTRDGPGIRTTVFLKGCPLSCWWCHNPESQSNLPEIIYREDLCIGCLDCLECCPQGALSSGADGILTNRALCLLCGACLESCVADARQAAGREMSVAAVMAEIRKDIAFYDQSGGGVTFSGGEPLAQPEFLGELLQACKDQGLRTAVDTSGFVPWSVIDGLRKQVDLFLYDLKTLDDDAHQRFTGVSNQRILENLRSLCASGQAVRVRVPLIPGLNDNLEDLRRLVDFLTSLPTCPEIELLSYHPSGVEKYHRLGRNCLLEDLLSPGEDYLRAIACQLEAYGMPGSSLMYEGHFEYALDREG